MSVSIPKPVTEDWRDKLARDDAKQRKIRLKNIDRDNKQADILFKEKQQKLYNNVVDVFPRKNWVPLFRNNPSSVVTLEII